VIVSLADALGLAGAVVGGTAALFAWFSLHVADRAARNDVVSELRGWANDVIDLLSEASELCGEEGAMLSPDESSRRKSQLATRASSLWDRGRLFFPNVHQDVFGMHKPSAYSGLRPPILDMLMLSYELCRRIDAKPTVGDNPRRKAFVHLKREFVSTIQAAISPSKAPSSAKKYEDFLPTVGVKDLPEEIRSLAGAERRGFQLRFRSNLEIDGGDQA
jgi:hypothetical protein